MKHDNIAHISMLWLLFWTPHCMWMSGCRHHVQCSMRNIAMTIKVPLLVTHTCMHIERNAMTRHSALQNISADNKVYSAGHFETCYVCLQAL